MRKLLTAGIFGTILSLTGVFTADASIISRGFFDEAMENYATNTALDLKANQTDLTALSNKIGTLPSGNFPDYTVYELLFPGLNQPLTYPTSLAELINAIYGNSETKEEGLLAAIFEGIPSYSAEDPVGVIPNYYLAKNANTKIGTLPTETAMSSCSVWRAIDLTQNEMPETIGGILEQLYSAGHRDGSCDHDGYNGPSLPNIIRKLIYGYNYNGGTEMLGINGLNVGFTDSTGNVIEPGLRQITNGWTDAKGGIINPGLKGMYDGWTDGDLTFPGLYSLSSNELKFRNTFGASVGSILSSGLPEFTFNEYTGPIYPLWKLSQGIGTLPSGNLPPIPGYEFLFTELDQPTTYPTSLAELINAIYGNLETRQSGLLQGIIAGFQIDDDQDGRPETPIGIIPNHYLAEHAEKLAVENATKIGTLPTQISGNDTTWARYGFETPIELPTTVGGMFDMLFHDERNSTEKRFSLSAIMANILTGSYRDDGSAVFYGLYDLTDALRLADGQENYPLVTAVKANTAAIEKIGTVPAGYDNVGAALTAMKSDIDAKNLPSTSDDGQYVLTAKKVGETITYTWVKMDLTTEEQGQ